MCRLILSFWFFFLTGIVPAVAGNRDDGLEAAILGFTGCTDIEEVGKEELERLTELYSAPLQLNLASRSKLLSSGLFTVYQAAVLLDYRDLAGDILSFEELAALDGFGYGFVSRLKYFTALRSSALPGHSSVRPPVIGNSAVIKSGIRNSGTTFSPEGNYAAKYRFTAGERFEAGLAVRSSYQGRHFPPEKVSFNAVYYGKGYPGKVIVGDYRLRFGQGLGLWSGFAPGGIASPESFSRRPSGISPCTSYSGEGSFRGIAADYGGKSLNISVFVSSEGLRDLSEGAGEVSDELMYGANAGWYGMSGQFSLTAFAVSSLSDSEFLCARSSADARFSVRGTDIFSEVACDLVNGKVAALAGFSTDMSEIVRIAALARYYPPEYSSLHGGAVSSGTKCSNEYGVTASVSHIAGKWVGINGKTGFGSSERRSQCLVSADASYSPEPKFGVDTSSFQIRLTVREKIRISPVFGMEVRFSERYRSYGQLFRSDLRADLRCSFSDWNLNLRMNALHCEGFSFLSYLEGGYAEGRLSLWLRTGWFRVDNWNDRIYAYERDAPGNFNVPAYYGRGYWIALTSGLGLSGSIKLYLRAGYIDYPCLRPAETENKPAKAELKLQLAVDLLSFPDRGR